MEKFGTRLRKLRLSNNLTQEKLVQDFNKKFHYSLSKSAISQYENHKRFPEINALVDFASYFDVSLDFLLCRTYLGNSMVEEEAAGYEIEAGAPTFYIDKYLAEFNDLVQAASRIVIFGKTATKKQITIINTCIEIGLKLAEKKFLRINDDAGSGDGDGGDAGSSGGGADDAGSNNGAGDNSGSDYDAGGGSSGGSGDGYGAGSGDGNGDSNSAGNDNHAGNGAGNDNGDGNGNGAGGGDRR